MIEAGGIQAGGITEDGGTVESDGTADIDDGAKAPSPVLTHQRLTLLAAFADQSFARLVREVFAQDCTLIEVGSGEVAMSSLLRGRGHADLVLLGPNLPAMNCFGFLRQIGAMSVFKHLPVVVCGPAGEAELAALELGAADYIPLPAYAPALRRRVELALARARQRRRWDNLRHRAESDALTGLYNRSEFEARINRFIAQEGEPHAAFVMLDLDNFKDLNDNLGHQKGDEALREIAEILRGFFGPGNLLARMGGDEFAVFLPFCSDETDLRRRLDELCRRLNLHYTGRCCSIVLSCSAGVCMAPGQGRDYPSLYAGADMALLAAKRQGKNQHRFYGPDMELPSPAVLQSADWLLDESSDAVFVVAAESYRLLYLNRSAAQLGRLPRGSGVGRPCYEAIFHRSTPCENCNKSCLSPHSFVEGERQLADGRHYWFQTKLISWNGQRAVMHHVQDDTDRRIQTDRCREALEREVALSACIEHLSACDSHGLDELLALVGGYFGAERCFILRQDKATGIVNKTHSFFRGNKNSCSAVQSFLIDDFPIWKKSFADKEPVQIADTKSLKERSPAEYAFFKHVGLRNSLCLCYEIDLHTAGCLGVYNLTAHQQDFSLLRAAAALVQKEEKLALLSQGRPAGEPAPGAER